MESRVSLIEIEQVISFCLHPVKEREIVLSFPWVKERLSWFARASGYLWGNRRESWLEKHLFPILLEVSIPYLESFLEGNWKAIDETRLKQLFDYFSIRIEACRAKISKSLEAFLQGPTPSFFQERAHGLALCSGRSNIQWYRDETFAQYKRRLNTLIHQNKKEKEPFQLKEEIKQPEYRPQALLQKSRERIEALIARLQKMKEECVLCNYQIDKDLAKAFPLRNEFELLVKAIQEVKEEVLSVLLSIEDEISKLSESFVTMTEEGVCDLFDEEEMRLKGFQETFKCIQKRSEENRVEVEERKNSLHKRLQQITRNIDKVQMLPASSGFRNHQSRLIRMARERVKKFREALSRGPGPDTHIDSLEKEVSLFVEMGNDFYNEGIEIESMRDQLTKFSNRAEKIIEKNGSTDILKSVLVDINMLRKNLEISADRKKHFEKIVRVFSDIDVLEEK